MICCYETTFASDIGSWPIPRKGKQTGKFQNRLTSRFMDAMDIVCGACPYISDVCDNDELFETAYVGNYEDANEKYCERCMVRNMYNLFKAERDAGAYLDYDSSEWQAIINY